MSGKSRNLVAFLMCLLLPVLVLGLQEGQSRDDVLAELGPPNGKRVLASGEIWVYSGDVTLEFGPEGLIRAKGLYMEAAPPVEAVPPVNEPELEEAEEIQATTGHVPQEVIPDPSPNEGEATDEELVEFAEKLSRPQELIDELEGEWEEPPSSDGFLKTALMWVLPVFLQWIFLMIAFKWVGAEAMKAVLLFIAVVDRFAVFGVEWIFKDLLHFPTTFHADLLVSIIVMLSLVTKMTHATQLPTAIKVVVSSKVASFIAFYLLVLLVLHNF